MAYTAVVTKESVSKLNNNIPVSTIKAMAGRTKISAVDGTTTISAPTGTTRIGA